MNTLDNQHGCWAGMNDAFGVSTVSAERPRVCMEDRHPKATPMRPQSHTKVTSKPQWKGRRRRCGLWSIWLRSDRVALDQLSPVGFQVTFHGVDPAHLGPSHLVQIP